MTLILMITALTLVHCQNTRYMTGIDAFGIAKGEASLSMERSICTHWSVGGNVSYGFGMLIKGMHPLERSHRQEFGDKTYITSPDNLHKESIYVRYWPMDLMKGPYMTVALSHGSWSGTDLHIGAGYILHIWKYFNIYTEYLYAISETDSPLKRLSAGICLIFGK